MPIKKNLKQNGVLLKILILAGVFVLVVVVFLIKNQPSKTVAPVDESPQAQLDRHLKEEKPIFVFFHSTTCQTCVVMMDTVAQVYPEFTGDVELVDVDVYDPQNKDLLEVAGINSIPTLVFINRKGQGTVSVGAMEADRLRQQLNILKETP